MKFIAYLVILATLCAVAYRFGRGPKPGQPPARIPGPAEIAGLIFLALIASWTVVLLSAKVFLACARGILF